MSSNGSELGLPVGSEFTPLGMLALVDRKLRRWHPRSLLRFALFLGSTVYYLLLYLSSTPRVERTVARVTRFARQWARLSLRWCGIQVEVRGTPPQKGVLLVANHRSYIDAPALLQDTDCSFLAKAELKRWPLLGFAARMGHVLFVSRDDKQSRRAARQAIKQRLQEGFSIMVFPEGTTFAGPGILPFKMGMFKTATEADIPVCPVAIDYRYRHHAWVGEDTFLGHFLRTFSEKTIQVTVHYGSALRHRDPETLRDMATAWIEGHLDGLRDFSPTQSSAGKTRRAS